MKDIESRPYIGWFGDGDTKTDVQEIVAQFGEPSEIALEADGGNMTVLLYPDKIIVCGYDGSEYVHNFQFPRTP